MKIAVQLGPPSGSPAEVAYKWDPDTEILSAQLLGGIASEGMSGSVGLEGSDGSWLVLDVSAGRINGVEIAVWPDVRKLQALSPPSEIEDAHVVIPARASQPNIASMEMATHMIAEADPAQRNFHFRLGKPKLTRTIRIARDLLLDVDDKSQISGLWLLNVPPAPVEL
ncbi:MAG: hypothetical protein ACREPM_22015 [Gemmatimonadaceae bacterium]